VSLEEIEGGIEIAVADTGQGIPTDNISRIFIPFYTTKEQGIGVGLSIVNRIVRSHGGIIEAQSTGRSGTTFVITMPIYKEQEV
jgi:signal transduction histidine kinase